MLTTALSEAADLCTASPNASLPDDVIAAVAKELLDPAIQDEEKARFLRAHTARGETAAELRLFSAAFLPHAVDPGFCSSVGGRELLDCCGTGGSGLDILNISTGMMFVLAACGVPVAKHGNVGVTKKSGSADVLRALGIRIDLPPELQRACLEEVGATFLFARQFHPAFKAVAPVRQKLAMEGRRTMFNLLGPLLNPARPAVQLTGVIRHEHLPLFSEALGATCTRRLALYGENSVGVPFGEVSITGETRYAGDVPEGIADWVEDQQEAPHAPSPLAAITAAEAVASSLHPDAATPAEQPHALSPEAAARYAELAALHVSGPEASAQMLTDLFASCAPGSHTPGAAAEVPPLARKLLLVNASVALVLHQTAPTLEAALALATEALDSGRALDKLQRMQAFSEKHAA
ncbi:anthranilate phosphoribosyltransferase [Verrucomicrobia bacterium LW23]|nr:anthranilate phosphoribosyltransferase [Verrucomicrobia bacterium LW23]